MRKLEASNGAHRGSLPPDIRVTVAWRVVSGRSSHGEEGNAVWRIDAGGRDQRTNGVKGIGSNS